MLCLGELTTLLPVPGGQVTLAGRFVDPAMAFAMGYATDLHYGITKFGLTRVLFLVGTIGIRGSLPFLLSCPPPPSLSTVRLPPPSLISPRLSLGADNAYGPITDWDSKINNAVWITITGIVVIIINFLGTRAFGECEFWFASIKVITIIGLIILGLVIDLGGAPNHDRLGFRYWVSFAPSLHLAWESNTKLGLCSTTLVLSHSTRVSQDLWVVSPVSGPS